jgi:hypothetical protein
MRRFKNYFFIRLFFLFRFLYSDTQSLLSIKKLLGDSQYLKELAQWKEREFKNPTPQFIKNSIFLEHSDKESVWIETGTYRGTSTKFLAQNNKFIHTIEAEKGFYSQTKIKLLNEGIQNISFNLGTSENLLEEIIQTINNEILCIWLDAHFSGAGTYKGEQDTPIINELEVIEKYISKFKRISILIDDIREFDNSNSEYPNKEYLIEWSNKNSFMWEIKFDMMIIYN